MYNMTSMCITAVKVSLPSKQIPWVLKLLFELKVQPSVQGERRGCEVRHCYIMPPSTHMLEIAICNGKTIFLIDSLANFFPFLVKMFIQTVRPLRT